MKIHPIYTGKRRTGVQVMMDRDLPFSLEDVMYSKETTDMPLEKKRGQNLVYRFHFHSKTFENSRHEECGIEHGTVRLDIVFGSGALKTGQSFSNKLIGVKLEKLLTKLLKFCEKYQEDLAAYMTFGYPLIHTPSTMLSLIAREPNTHWQKNLRKDQKMNLERVQDMMKELRRDIARTQRMQATTREKEEA